MQSFSVGKCLFCSGWGWGEGEERDGAARLQGTLTSLAYSDIIDRAKPTLDPVGRTTLPADVVRTWECSSSSSPARASHSAAAAAASARAAATAASAWTDRSAAATVTCSLRTRQVSFRRSRGNASYTLDRPVSVGVYVVARVVEHNAGSDPKVPN